MILISVMVASAQDNSIVKIEPKVAITEKGKSLGMMSMNNSPALPQYLKFEAKDEEQIILESNRRDVRSITNSQ